MSRSIFYKDNCWLVIGTAAFILLLLAIAYQPVMFNFFCSDDFYIVGWLNQCKQNISMLFQTVYEGTPYYRPVLNLFLFIEYLLCGANGICFRLVSLSYLLITAFILWQLVAKFADGIYGDMNSAEVTKTKKRTKTNWCLFAIGFFLLFPLHTEPVDWFVCTTELLANIFILSSFLFFIHWRNKGLLRFQLISYMFAACAFLTKEIAVILPAILFLYDLLTNDKSVNKKILAKPDQVGIAMIRMPALKVLAFKLFTVMQVTAGYWLLLVMYLCLRKIMTGEFLGNWSNVAFHFSDNQMMFGAWWQSIKTILCPISTAAFGHNIPVRIAWILMLIDLTFLTINSAFKRPRIILLLTFLVGWFFISLIPMARLLFITPDLLDARYGYIASIPLCIFLMFGLAASYRPKGINLARHSIFIVILSFCCLVLRLNNLAWAQAGELTNNMLDGFRIIHRQVPDTTRVYFVNIPVKYNGVAIAGLKSINAMNHIPFANNNYDNCIWLLDEDQSLPIGLMSADLDRSIIKSRFYFLNATKHFSPIIFNKFKCDNYIQDLGTPKVVPTHNSVFLFYPKNLECRACDALVFKLNIKRAGSNLKDAYAKLTFTNDIRAINNNEESILAPLNAKESDQTLIFLLRGKPIWTLGGLCHSIRVSFPRNYDVRIDSAHAIAITNAMPKFSFKSGNYDNQVAQLNLDARCPNAIIDYDVSFIDNCAGVKIETIDSSEYFSELNSQSSNNRSLSDWRYMKAKGQIKFDRVMFKTPGFYKVRLCPLDRDGKQCAFCSDHFILHIAND